MNSTSVFLKWKPPPTVSQNGVIRSYLVMVEGIGVNNLTISTSTASLLLTNLTAGVTYTVKAAASTRAGPGPFSPPATLRLDPASRLLLKDQQHRQSLDAEDNLSDNSYFLTETWFIALLGSMVAVMVLLFAAMLFVRRRQIIMKKSTLHESRSNGGVLATPLSLKAAVGLPHPLANHPNDSTLWIENRPTWRITDAGDKESEARLLRQYVQAADKLENMPDYAEVDANHALTTFQGSDERSSSMCCSSEEGSSSPAPYATTTIATGSRTHLNGLGWMHITANPNPDENPYPQKNIYSDTYFYNINCQPAEYGHTKMAKPPIPPNPPSPAFNNTLRRGHKRSQGRIERERSNSRTSQTSLCNHTEDRSPPSPPAYSRSTWKNGPKSPTNFNAPAQSLSSFGGANVTRHGYFQYQPVYHNSTRSEPGHPT